MGSVSPADAEPDRKRVRFTPSEHSPADPAKPATLSANKVVELRFLHHRSQLSPAAAREPHPHSLITHPPYLHQIVPKEAVAGWNRLVVAVYVHLPSLSYWIDSDGDRAELPAPPAPAPDHPEQSERTDVPALLAPFVKGGLCPTRSSFEEAMAAAPTSPLKNCVMQYKKNGKNFAVYKEGFAVKGDTGSNVRNEDFLNFHRRMAFLMFVHIDGASFIDDEDPRWEVYVVVEQSENDTSVQEFVGYATTYPFSVLRKSNAEEGKAMSFADRIRISQVFVSPLRQGQGHGSKLLHAVYNNAKERKAIEVTVEDPSIGFRLLRDVTDLKRSYEAGILDSAKVFPYDTEEQLVAVLREDLLLTAGQARRCLEVHQLKYTDRENEEAYKKYRLWVKRRLFKENYEVLDSYEKEERKVKLAEIYEEYEKEYFDAVSRLKVKQQNP